MMVYTIEGVTFKYEGGPYIDVFAEGSDVPGDTINVWDYMTNTSEVQGLADFYAECESWFSDQYDSDEDEEDYDDDSYDEFDDFESDLEDEWKSFV